jgi:hypothetical protein
LLVVEAAEGDERKKDEDDAAEDEEEADGDDTRADEASPAVLGDGITVAVG